LIFQGRATRKDTIKFDAQVWGFFGYAAVYDFDVDRVWRGDIARSVQVMTGTYAGDCGIPFRVGERRLVVAREAQGTWVTDTCIGVAVTEERAALAMLGPAPVSYGRDVRGGFAAYRVAIAVLLMLAGGSVAWRALTRRRLRRR
jgi:hypothetical protein